MGRRPKKYKLAKWELNYMNRSSVCAYDGFSCLTFFQGFGSAFFSADPDPGKNFHADPDPGGIRGGGKGKNEIFF